MLSMNKFRTVVAGVLWGIFLAGRACAAESEFAPVTDTKLIQSIDAIVAQDAGSWMFNRYDGGSLRNVQYVELDAPANKKTVLFYGEYTYNRGSGGWVKMQISQTGEELSVDCIEFWDFRGQCRPLGRSPSQAIMGSMVEAIAMDIITSPVSAPSEGGGGCLADRVACSNEHYNSAGEIVDDYGNRR